MAKLGRSVTIRLSEDEAAWLAGHAADSRRTRSDVMRGALRLLILDQPALARRCRDCGATPGESCREDDGKPMPHFHGGRF